MPKNIGPGPGAYMLPPTVGYNNHDTSRYRNPQYTIPGKCGLTGKAFGPGPQYAIDKFTRYGKISPPAYTLPTKLKGFTPFRTPGPGTYSPEKGPRMKDPRPPAYSIAGRHAPFRKFNTPGPNQYTVPSALGPKVPQLPASAAYSMAQKHDFKGQPGSPGPARYEGINVNLYKNKDPQYSIRARCGPVGGKGQTPGPAAYLPKLADKVPGGLSFGVKTDKLPYVTAEDHMPCIE